MGYHVTIETGSGNKAEKLPTNRFTIESDKKGKAFTSLQKGQQISGEVVAVGDQVTINFSGQMITASNSVMGNAAVGDVKTFEVMKANGNEVELRLIDDFNDNIKKAKKAALAKESDWDSIMSKKEQTAKQAEKDAEYNNTKSKLDEISSKMTEQDCKQLESEGFSINSFTIDGLSEALNRVKSGISGKENSTAKITAFDDTAITNRLNEENLPATEENISKIQEALALGGSASNMDDKAMKYMISTGAVPSAENIYKACYSGSTQNQGNVTTLSEKAWGELANQVKDVISSAGFEVNEENLKDARWLIENNLPLTTASFTYRKDLEQIQSKSNKNANLDKMMEGMKNGINPKDVSLADQNTTDPEQVIAFINSISEEAVAQAVREDSELTIKRLVTIQESLAANKKAEQTAASDAKLADKQEASDAENNETAESLNDNQFKEIKAKRQLEEIRLKMTLEAANTLEKKGISVETEQLSKVVDALRELEDNYYKNLLKEAEADTSDLSVQILKETTQSIEQLKFMPSSILGSTISESSTQSVAGLLTEGSKVQAAFGKAGAAYETLMTVPNSEYGDSIKKAFANANSLLSEMGLENTEPNNRAVRILGYNQMEITEASMNQVKAYDKQVTTLMQNLHPAVTVRMIKDGINPLDMPINELNTMIDQMKEEQGITSEDKYSTYLRNLEKENGITSEERKAYIGIYRLLYNIDKSDGAALGSVIKADREVTLDNLLTAVQTSKKGSLDAVIDDEFGSLQSISKDKETIAEQLSSFTEGIGQQNSDQAQSNTSVEEQTEYLNRIVKEMKDSLSPEALKEAGSSLSQSQVKQALPLLSSDRGIWETIKDVPVEKLYEQLQNMEEPQAEDNEVYAAKVQEIRELCKNSEQSIRFLNDYHIPTSPQSIMLVNNILSNAESPIKKLMKLKSENTIENSENSLKETNDLSDNLIDKNSMQETYEQLETDAKSALVQACSGEKIDSQKLAELKSMGQQLTFAKKLAEKEFYQIPIETDHGITNMNLTIIRGTETSGKVSVSVASEQLGNIKAELSLKDQTLKGYFSSDNQEGLEKLQQCTGEIGNVAQDNNVTIKQMDYYIQRKDSDAYSYQNTEHGTNGDSVTNDTERILYRMAKAIVQTVRTAENIGSDTNRAVS